MKSYALLPLSGLLLSSLLPAQAGDLAKSRFDVLDTRVEMIEGAQGSSYRISLDAGRTWTEEEATKPQLELIYRRFDPLSGEPYVPEFLRSTAANRLYIVQYKTTELEAYRRVLRNLGVEIHNHLPWQASLVRMSASQASKLRTLPFVRWVGAYHPAYRLQPEIRAELFEGGEIESREYNIMMVDAPKDRAGLIASIAKADGVLAKDQVGFVYVIARLNKRQLLDLAADDQVLWIDRTTPEEEDMDIVRNFGGANYVEGKGQFTGKGVRGNIFEGVYENHKEFAATSPWRTAPSYITKAGNSTHGTATFGVIFAKGVTPKARGLMPDGQGSYTYYSGVNRHTLVGLLRDPSQSYKNMFQTASWGYARTTSYLSTSAEMDRIIFDWDFPITQSQSNAGATSIPRNSRPQAWAKNIFSIGGVRHYDTLSAADDKWAQSGSIGPAADGRIKPDLCGFYDSCYTTYSSTGYGTFGGTSNATPVNAGHLGLSIEFWTDGLFGHTKAAWNNRFPYRPHAMTSKAMMINTARQYPFVGASHDLTRVHVGWGHPHVGNLYDNRDSMLIVNEEDPLLNKGQNRYFVLVKAGAPETKFTMVYKEPEGSPSSSIQRINDLDLKVSRFGTSTVWWGNQGLLAGNYSTSGGSANTVDPVENVFLQKPAGGVYIVDINGSSIVRDTHMSTKVTDADYALVISGINGNRDMSGPVLALTSKGTGDLSFNLSNLPTGYTEGFTFLSLTTSKAVGHGNFFGIEYDNLTGATLIWPKSKGDPIHFPSTTDTQAFPNAGFTIPAGALLLLKGLSMDGVTLFANAQGFFDSSNVSRVKL